MLHGLRQQAAISLAALALATPAGAADHGTPLPTRLVQAAVQAEESVLAAARAHDARQLEGLLGDDFSMISATHADSPVPYEAWVDAMVRPGAGDYAVRAVLAQEVAPGRVLSSLVLQPRARQAAVFVVDLWQSDVTPWRLLSRHAARAGGPAKALPGDAPSQDLPKKF
ncbi:hypothetical protein [Roseateles saccharophilus]|uniref:DUF4440 domain-containing protein n=1 Tax=Roseateles saccharophilus TaxID=304 RepID=A0A4R3VBQ7_ROSSA|nr:hypothetical protein [Roseateles saccharophilus]MDG0831572.1 hypothetical protein [Roseateles saccharophilus]TCV01018.1 hypothetical protein EV671_1007147 [Roseateles saccharophilus]